MRIAPLRPSSDVQANCLNRGSYAIQCSHSPKDQVGSATVVPVFALAKAQQGFGGSLGGQVKSVQNSGLIVGLKLLNLDR